MTVWIITFHWEVEHKKRIQKQWSHKVLITLKLLQNSEPAFCCATVHSLR